MGKNNSGLVYCRLINATVLYLLTTVLYFYIAHMTFYGRYCTAFVFDPPMQNTINISNNLKSFIYSPRQVLFKCLNMCMACLCMPQSHL